MLLRTYTQAELATALRHVAEGEARVSRQNDLIDELMCDGRATERAEGLLATMVEALALSRGHVDVVQAQLRQGSDEADIKGDLRL